MHLSRNDLMSLALIPNDRNFMHLVNVHVALGLRFPMVHTLYVLRRARAKFSEGDTEIADAKTVLKTVLGGGGQKWVDLTCKSHTDLYL